MAVLAAVDRPFFVDSPAGPLFGVASIPDSGEPRGTVVLAAGGWYGGSSLKNRVLVRLAHRLAEAGLQAVRFDWQGSGESAGHVDRFALYEPTVGDIEAVVDAVASDGEPLYLVGICYGARAVVPVAADRKDLAGMVLIALPILAQAGANKKQQRAQTLGAGNAVRAALRPSVIKGWFDPATRAVYVKWLRIRVDKALRRAPRKRRPVPDSLQEVATVLDAGVPTLFLYGTEDWEAASEEATAEETTTHEPLVHLVDRYNGVAELQTTPGDLHGFPDLDVQTRTIDIVTDWLARTATAGPEAR